MYRNKKLMKVIQIFHRNYSKNSLPSSKLIRKQFLDYFIEQHEHQFVRSSPVIPYFDPTVAFVNAGMNQFKNIFLGKTTPTYKRVVNSQKCIRVGGKHNDLSIVGTDSYHHTFFEMLGNWSFNDYFKEEACRMAWNLLTGPYGIDPSRLYVTYFGGDEQLNLPADLECLEIWKSLGLSADRILPFGAVDNFWEMGSTGPCGPCTEIHIDHHPKPIINRSKLVNQNRPDLTEIWNLVFIQYNRQVDGSIERLPCQHIDTGMGFERLVTVLQGRTSNYDTDLFQPIIKQIETVTKRPPYVGTFDRTDSNFELDTAYRILADHIRMIAVCVSDGMFPEQNQKLRRIIRKSILLSERTFNNSSKLLTELIPILIEQFSDVYPEIDRNQNNVRTVIDVENDLLKHLLKTQSKYGKIILENSPSLDEYDLMEYPGLIAGWKELQEAIGRNEPISGELLFCLYDRHGLNISIIEKMIGKEVDRTGFERELNKNRQRTKSLFADFHQQTIGGISNKITRPTDDHFKYNYNYDQTERIYKTKSIEVEILDIISLNDPEKIVIIFDKSNFYIESGGQQGDRGFLRTNRSIKLPIDGVQSNDGVLYHAVRTVGENQLKIGDRVELIIDDRRRSSNIRNHTGAHLLNASVRNEMPTVVYQKSNSVTDGYFRLELGCLQGKVDLETIGNIEKLARKIIRSSCPVHVDQITSDDFLKQSDIIIVPGEIYPDTGLRLIRIENVENRFASKELCCGTHAFNTSELIDFSIVQVKPTGRGSYQFTAVTGDIAEQTIRNGIELIREVDEIESFVRINRKGSEEISILKNRLNRKDYLLPYTIKMDCLNRLLACEQSLKIDKKLLIKHSLDREMKNLIDSHRTNKFIIHFLTIDLETISLQKVTNQYPTDQSILLLSLSNGVTIKGICCVPKSQVNEIFNADNWLSVVAKHFQTKSESVKDQNKEEICIFKDRRILNRNEFKDQLEKALTEAKIFADENC